MIYHPFNRPEPYMYVLVHILPLTIEHWFRLINYQITLVYLDLKLGRGVESDLVYPDNLVPFKMTSDFESYELLNHFK